MSLKRRGTAARRPETTRRQFLQMEQLEERAVLAGNVTTYNIAGYLTLIGDAAGNELQLTRVGTSQVQITPLAGTKINGSANPVTLNNVTSGLTALMGEGNDVLEFRGSTTRNFIINGLTTISMAGGNDTVRFYNYATAKGLFLDMGSGNDTLIGARDPLAPAITAGGLRVDGAAIISTGFGNDTVSLQNSAFNKTFRLDSGFDNDTVDIRNSEIRSVSTIYDSYGTDSLNNAGNTFSPIFAPFIYGYETRTAVNGPTAGNDAVTVAEGGNATITVLSNDTANGGAINPATVAIVTAPTRGTAVVNANGTITYTNGGGEFLTDSLTYTVRDAQGNISNTATVNITITPVNDLPVAVADAFTVTEGATTTLNIGQNDTDAENRLNLSSIVITQQPASGTVTVGTNGNVTYTGNATALTTDTFQYTIADLDTGVSLAGIVTLTITQVNSPPTIANIVDLATNEDTATSSIAVTIDDAETAAAALTVAASSDNPTLLPPGSFVFGGSGTARTLIITPAANLSGSATVTVTVTDSDNATTTDTFVLTVNAQNDVPTISGATAVTTNEDTASAAMTINVGDLETPDGLTVTATSSDPSVVANNGVGISGSGATRSIVVTPVANAFGTTTITLTVSDGTATATQTFVVTVNSVNDDPTLTAISDVTAEVGTSIPAVIATGSDVETAAGSLTYSATSDNQAVIADGGLVFTNNSLQITPVAATTGVANITVRVTDADGGFAEQVFTVTIDSAPTISAIADQTIDVNATTGALLFTVGDSETDEGDLTLSVTSSDLTLVPLENISFGGSGANRAVTVSPAAGLTGSSTIRVTVSDASGLNSFEEFVVTVNPVNALPTISTIGDISRDEDTPILPFDFTIGDAETAVNDLIVSISSNNQALFADGSLSVSTTGTTRTVTMAQVPNASGTAIITVTVDDGDGGVASETFTVSILPINDAPTAGAAAGTVGEGGNVVIDLGVISNDPEGALNLAGGILITNQPANGSVALNGNGTVTYTHNGSETLTDSFTYTIADAEGNVSNEATVSVTITPVNDGPDAVNDTATANIVVGSMDPVVITGNLLGNDTDSDTAAASLFVSALSQGAIGTPIQLTYGDFTINADGSWTYTVDDVDAILAATDPEELLSYTLSDGELTDLATLTIDFNITGA